MTDPSAVIAVTPGRSCLGSDQLPKGSFGSLACITYKVWGDWVQGNALKYMYSWPLIWRSSGLHISDKHESSRMTFDGEFLKLDSFWEEMILMAFCEFVDNVRK